MHILLVKNINGNKVIKIISLESEAIAVCNENAVPPFIFQLHPLNVLNNVSGIFFRHISILNRIYSERRRKGQWIIL